MQQQDELIMMLEEAQIHLYEAIELLEEYVRITHDRHADAYVVAHLKIMAGRDHGYLSRDTNIDDLLDQVRDGG